MLSAVLASTSFCVGRQIWTFSCYYCVKTFIWRLSKNAAKRYFGLIVHYRLSRCVCFLCSSHRIASWISAEPWCQHFFELWRSYRQYKSPECSLVAQYGHWSPTVRSWGTGTTGVGRVDAGDAVARGIYTRFNWPCWSSSIKMIANVYTVIECWTNIFLTINPKSASVSAAIASVRRRSLTLPLLLW